MIELGIAFAFPGDPGKGKTYFGVGPQPGLSFQVPALPLSVYSPDSFSAISPSATSPLLSLDNIIYKYYLTYKDHEFFLGVALSTSGIERGPYFRSGCSECDAIVR